MDLLSKVYSSTSDEDEDGNGKAEEEALAWRPQKRPKFEPFNQNFKSVPVIQPNISPNLPLDGPIPGRYISKRERSALASASMISTPNQPPSPISPGFSPFASFVLFNLRIYVSFWLAIWTNVIKKS